MFRQSAYVCLLLAVLFAASLLRVGVAPADPGGIPHMQGEVIIKFKANASQHDKDMVLGQLGGSKIKGLGRIKAELRRLGDEVTVEEAVALFQNNPKIEYIEPNYIWEAVEVPNDPMFNQLWGMENTGQTGGTPGADIHATNAWDVFTGSSSTLIGVIDTGIDYTHPDLAANVWTNPGEIPGNGIDDDLNGYVDDIHGWDFVNNDNDPMDDNGHGTHCSGTIGGVGNNGIGVAGVNWNVKIMGLKFLSAGGSGSTADATEAIEYATMMGVRLTSNSWGGGGFSQALLDAIEDANAAGILFVAAAGNSSSNTDVSPHYPSSYPSTNIVAVAATDHNDELASFSSYGATTVDLGAPGVDILSTLPGNNYGVYSGTSMATPHVSGALGLVFGRFPSIGHLDAKSLILSLADPAPALTGKCVTGARLNAFLPIADPDSIPPGQITDLAVTSEGSNWLMLAWTATGDDDDMGTASRYEVRYSTSPIDDMNFAAATPAPFPPDPGEAGMPEAMTLGGLNFSTTYYVAIRAFDEFGNGSPVSNAPMGTTLGPPDIDVAPLSLAETLLTGATATQNLTLSNLAPNTTLDFEIPLPDLITIPPTITEYVEYGKGELDPRTGNPVLEGSGGPDGFGYRWADSDDPFGPAFNWVDISGSGTPALTSGDDANQGPFPIGFAFPFYGGEYTSFRVCSNGWLSFTSTSTAYSNQELPNPAAPSTMIAPFWDDLDLSTTGTVYYESDGSRLIVQWEAVPHYSSGGPYTFQAIIRADGSMKFQYLSMGTPDNSATVGIQNNGGTDGLTVAFNTPYIHDGLAIRLEAVPQWMTVTPGSGTVYGVGSQGAVVSFDASGLLGGTYEGNIRVVSNDPDESPFLIPVSLTVIGAPDISVEPLAHDFGPVFFGSTPAFSFLVSNPGTDVLHVSSVSIGDGAFTADLASFDVPPRGDVNLTITFDAPGIGAYATDMTITSDDPDQPTTVVSLAGEAVVPPDFNVTPASLSSALFSGESETQQLTIQNSGGADLEYSIGVQTEVETFVNTAVELQKGEEDPGPGILGAGGPDTFGYSWIDSDEPGGPVFDWVDISGIGTPIFGGNADDSNQGPFPIGFDFPYYGDSFPTFRVSSNGFITFTSTSTAYSNAILPGTGGPENLLAVYWDDMYVDADIPSEVYYHNDGTRLIVQFDQVRRYSQGDTSPPFYTFEAILYPNGKIVYQYLTVGSVNNSATHGFQNGARDDGLTIAYNENYAHDGLAVVIASAPEWLSATPTSGIIPPGGSQPVTVLFNADGLFGGLYSGSIDITTNDPVAPLVQVPATLDVTGAPDMVMTPTLMDFGQVFVGYPDRATFTIRNEGTDVLTVSDMSTDNPDFLVDLTQVQLPLDLQPFQQVLVGALFTPTSPGAQASMLAVESNDPGAPTEYVQLMGEGLLPPEAEVPPVNPSGDLLTGQTATQPVPLSNTGPTELTFDTQVILNAPAEVIPKIEPDLEKGMEDPNPGILGQGGPDNYGYSWIDSDDPGGPVYDWVDISQIGTPIYTGTSNDDQNRGPFPIGFEFPFYGNSFPEFRVCSNGWVSFTSSATGYSNTTLPSSASSSTPENMLAAYWDDLNVDLTRGGQVFYYNDGSRLIVQFEEVRRLANTTPPFNTFQIILYPNGAIIYQYEQFGPLTNSATIGIQNAARDDGLTVVYNEDYVHPELAIRIATTPEWLSVSPTSGVVPPAGMMNLNIMFDATGLFGGDYTGTVRVLTNDPANGLLEIPCSLHVTGVPRIGFSAASVDFGNVFIGYPAEQVLTVTNIGTDHLSVTGIMPGLTDYSATPATLELDPLASAELTVAFGPITDGDRATDLTFSSNDPDSPHTVALTGTGVVPPVAMATPDPVVGAAMPGGSKTKPLTLCNTGGSDLIFQVSAAEAVATAVQVHSYLELPKGEDVPGSSESIDPRPGILGTGGPDMFGYTWTDSDEPGGPVYDWVDISGTGTPTFSAYSDDGNRGPFPIGFDFSFYGNTFSEFNVCSNGWLSFTNGSLATYSNQPLPNDGSAVPENLLALFWDDMVVDPLDDGEIYYEYDGSRLIIQYEIRRLGTGGSPPFFSLEIILYPNGNIVYQYQTLGTTVNSATIGIQNEAKDDGLTVVYNDDYVHEGLAIRFSSSPAWLSVSPESGVVPAGECLDLTVNMNAAELGAGDYMGDITILSNDPANPTLTNGVVFHVGTVDASYTDVDPNTLNLGSNGNWVKAVVELPEPYSVGDIVLETVRLQGVIPAVTMSIGDDNKNGIPDATFKFDRAALEGILPEGDMVEMTVTGEIMDTIYFVGTDWIRAINPQLMMPNGGEQLLAGQALTIQWANPDGWDVDHATVTYSPDGGQTWMLAAENVVGESTVWMVPSTLTVEGLLRVYLFDGNGIMGSDTSDGPFQIMSSTVAAENLLPVTHRLYQNAPNPFRSTTRIAFDLPEEASVTLRVYDISGRVVRVLSQATLSAGRHEVSWDGRDDAGRAIAAGLYFYRLQAGEFTANKRMFFVR